MHRRHFFQASAILGLLPLHGRHAAAQDIATPAPSPEFTDPGGMPLDTRARELIDQLSRIPALSLLEALETGEVTDSDLTEAATGNTPHPLPWNDPMDTDLDHALGGVLIAANDAPLNSPDLEILGAYIVFETAEIAYNELIRRMDEFASNMSTSVAGIKMWIVEEEGMQLGITRLANVLLIANLAVAANTGEGLVLHLDAVARSLS